MLLDDIIMQDNNDKEMVRWKSTKTVFIKMYIEYCKNLVIKREIDVTDYGFLMELSLFLNYEDNTLVNEDGKYMSFKEILEFTGVERTKAIRIMSKLKKFGLLHAIPHFKDKRKSVYYINPNVVFKGIKIDKLQRDKFKKRKCKFIIKKNNKCKIYKKSNITERKVENVLVDNIELIENGMKYIKRQFSVDNGRIDILARDKNNKLCIIEIKNVKDCKDLLFQCSYYPTQFDEDVRMIAIAPGYTNKIKMALENIDVEIYKFKFDENKNMKVYKL